MTWRLQQLFSFFFFFLISPTKKRKVLTDNKFALDYKQKQQMFGHLPENHQLIEQTWSNLRVTVTVTLSSAKANLMISSHILEILDSQKRTDNPKT